jgi:hypothetical protein
MSTLHTPTVGGTYAVNASRKGKFNMHVTDIRGEWVDGVIEETGEEITVRQCLATFTLIPA